MNDPAYQEVLAKVREADRKRACLAGDPYIEISRLKRELISAEYNLKMEREKVEKLAPLAAEMVLWHTLGKEEQMRAHWDELMVMAKLAQPDFFDMIDMTSNGPKCEYFQRYLLPFLKDPYDDQDD